MKAAKANQFQGSLFDPYPASPGYRLTDTSFKAAKDISSSKRAARLRNRCLEIFKFGEFTADELARQINESVLSVRPRVTELSKLGEIVDTGIRRRNESGKFAIVWKAGKVF